MISYKLTLVVPIILPGIANYTFVGKEIQLPFIPTRDTVLVLENETFEFVVANEVIFFPPTRLFSGMSAILSRPDVSLVRSAIYTNSMLTCPQHIDPAEVKKLLDYYEERGWLQVIHGAEILLRHIPAVTPFDVAARRYTSLMPQDDLRKVKK